jgi:hypothetical protein
VTRFLVVVNLVLTVALIALVGTVLLRPSTFRLATQYQVKRLQADSQSSTQNSKQALASEVQAVAAAQATAASPKVDAANTDGGDRGTPRSSPRGGSDHRSDDVPQRR